MGVLEDILPADRSDAAPITTHLRGLLEQLHNGQGERPRITITLDTDAWAMLEAQFRRPYKPHSSYMYLPMDVGTVAFERKREAVAEVAGLPPKGFAPPLGTPYTHLLPEPDCHVCRGPCRSRFICHAPGCLEDRPGRAESPWCPLHAQESDSPRSWDAAAIEAKAAMLAPRDAITIVEEASARASRPESAIYTAPMTGAEATYGGPWKGNGK